MTEQTPNRDAFRSINMLVEEGLQKLQNGCFGLDGDYHGTDELVITQINLNMDTHRYEDLRYGSTWGYGVWDQRIPRDDIKWLHEFKYRSYMPGNGSWITCRAHVFPDRDGYLETFDHEIPSRDAYGNLESTSRYAGAQGLCAELFRFPRTRENIPEHMWAVLDAEGRTPPLYNPSTSRVEYNNRSYAVTDRGVPAGTDLIEDGQIIDPTLEPKGLKKLFGKKRRT